MRSRFLPALAILSLFGILLSGCGTLPENAGAQSEAPAKGLQGQEAAEPSRYLSITYGRNNPDMPLGREIVFYTYDPAAGELQEVCTLPFNARYASGVVSLENQMVYYSRRMEEEDPASDDCLWAYDLASGESTRLEHENFSYNDITIVDPDTLLVMAVKAGEEHVITPALFDLTDGTFTYLPEVNGEPLTQYSTGASAINYNGCTGQFCYIYRDQKEMYLPEYLGMRLPIDVHIGLVGADLVKEPEKIYTAQWKSTKDIDWLTQVTDDTILMQVGTEVIDPENPTVNHDEIAYYTIAFGAEDAVLEPAAPPFPDAACVNLINCQTLDGGKTYYLQMNRVDDTSGLFSYCTDTGELRPILLNDDAQEGHVVNFCAVG